MAKRISFELYRYQILPKDRLLQKSLFDQSLVDIEALLSKKNDLFFTALQAAITFSTSKTSLTHQVDFVDSDSILLKIAANRSLNAETRDFKKTQYDNWPSIYVFINNNPERQVFAVQHRSQAFQNTELVVKAIISVLNQILGQQNLVVKYEPIYKRNTFWDLFQEYAGRIEDIRFKLITPNMSNISKSLSEGMKEFAKSTNAVESQISIQADKESSIVVDRNNAQLKGLVEYSELGGGDVSLKAKGISKRISSKKSIEQVSIDELEIFGRAEEVSVLFKNLTDV